jgi:hypothetical protein
VARDALLHDCAKCGQRGADVVAASQWYLGVGPITNNVFSATLDKYAGGQCISCAYVAPTLVGNDGTITITFTSPTTATADLAGGRHIQIERYFQQ